MLIIIVLLFVLILALARGGSLNALINLPVRQLWLFFVPLALQLLVFTPVVDFLPAGTDTAKFVYLASMLIAALALALNRQLPGVGWVAVGLSLNLLVIVVNGGFMPVSPEARQFTGMPPLSGRDNNVIPMTASTPLWFLGDILALPSWIPLTNVFSLGDVLITLGGVRFILQTVRAPQAAHQDSPRA